MIALGIASLLLVQNQGSSIPPIDFRNLPYQQQVQKMADGWRAKYNLPGVWCAFTKDGKIVACVASGVKNIETQAPALVTDHLNIGSVSKVITGSMIAQFVSRGVISYDTTIEEVFPELASKWPYSPFRKATLGQLTTHTSGLTKETRFDTTDEKNGITWRLKHVPIALASNVMKEPGSTYEYNNIGPLIAVAMLERRLIGNPRDPHWGPNYESWITGVPGKAIGLTSPRSLNWVQAVKVDEVCPHFINADGNPTANSKALSNRINTSFIYAPQGSCSITLPDLCSFALSSLNNRSGLTEQVFARSITPAYPRVSAHSLTGWRADGKWIEHSGNTGRGEYCQVDLNLPMNRAFIVYTNANWSKKETAKFGPILRELFDLGWSK